MEAIDEAEFKLRPDTDAVELCLRCSPAGQAACCRLHTRCEHCALSALLRSRKKAYNTIQLREVRTLHLPDVGPPPPDMRGLYALHVHL